MFFPRKLFIFLVFIPVFLGLYLILGNTKVLAQDNNDACGAGDPNGVGNCSTYAPTLGGPASFCSGPNPAINLPVWHNGGGNVPPTQMQVWRSDYGVIWQGGWGPAIGQWYTWGTDFPAVNNNYYVYMVRFYNGFWSNWSNQVGVYTSSCAPPDLVQVQPNCSGAQPYMNLLVHTGNTYNVSEMQVWRSDWGTFWDSGWGPQPGGQYLWGSDSNVINNNYYVYMVRQYTPQNGQWSPWSNQAGSYTNSCASPDLVQIQPNCSGTQPIMNLLVHTGNTINVSRMQVWRSDWGIFWDSGWAPPANWQGVWGSDTNVANNYAYTYMVRQYTPQNGQWSPWSGQLSAYTSNCNAPSIQSMAPGCNPNPYMNMNVLNPGNIYNISRMQVWRSDWGIFWDSGWGPAPGGTYAWGPDTNVANNNYYIYMVREYSAVNGQWSPWSAQVGGYTGNCTAPTITSVYSGCSGTAPYMGMYVTTPGNSYNTSQMRIWRSDWGVFWQGGWGPGPGVNQAWGNDTNVNNNYGYTYMVSEYAGTGIDVGNGAGWSPWSGQVAGYSNNCGGQPAPFGAGSTLTAGCTGTTPWVDITIKNPANSFNISQGQLQRNAVTIWGPAPWVVGPNSTTYWGRDITGLANSTAYTYQFRQYSAVNNQWSSWTPGNVTTADCSGPAAFGLQAKPAGSCPSAGNSIMSLSWSAAPSTTTVNYTINLQDTGTGATLTPLGVGTALSANLTTIHGLVVGHTYRFLITATNAHGSISSNNGSWSDAVFGTGSAFLNCGNPIVGITLDNTGSPNESNIISGSTVVIHYTVTNADYCVTSVNADVPPITTPWTNLYPPVTGGYTQLSAPFTNINSTVSTTVYNNTTYPHNSYTFNLQCKNSNLAPVAGVNPASVISTATVNVELNPFIKTQQGDVHTNGNIQVP